MAGGTPLLLTLGAIEARTLADHDRADRLAAFEAGLTFAVVDTKLGCIAARLAVGIAIAAESRTTAANGLAQDLRGDRRDPFDLGASHPAATASGAHTRAKEDFGGVDITDPRYDPLIHQE